MQNRQKGFANLILIFLVVIAGVGGIGYYAFKSGQLKTNLAPSAPTPNVTDTKTTTPTENPQASWKTFTNTKYNFQFNYPSDYSVGQNGINSDNPELSGGVFAGNYSAKDFPDEPRFTASVDLRPGSLEQKARNFFNKWSNFSAESGYPATNNSVVSDFEKTTFDGKSAFMYTISGSYYSDGSAEGLSANRQRKYIWVQNGNNTFIIRADNVPPTDQMLTTFKFLD